MLTEPDALRRRLREISNKTRAHLHLRGVYGRGKVETRRFVHDRHAGRHAWALAHEHAIGGLVVLDRGELAKASVLLWAAERFYTCALEATANTKRMAESAERSGRPPKVAERDARIVVAAEAQRRRGLRGTQAIAAAKRAEPALFAGLTHKRVQNILSMSKNHP